MADHPTDQTSRDDKAQAQAQAHTQVVPARDLADGAVRVEGAVASLGEERATHRDPFKPKIVAFVCNWCTYAGADLAGTSRLKMAANPRIVRLPCTGRIDPLFIIKAFERGADGVIVSGCHPADCHYSTGNLHARRRFTVFRELFQFMGMDLRRLVFSWVSASEGRKWADLVNETVQTLMDLGPCNPYPSTNREEIE